jgi:hypothetical protein
MTTWLARIMMIAASTIYRPFVVGVRAAGCCDHSAARLFYQIILRSSTVCLFDVCLLFIVVTIQQCCRFADCRGWGGQKSRLAMGAGAPSQNFVEISSVLLAPSTETSVFGTRGDGSGMGGNDARKGIGHSLLRVMRSNRRDGAHCSKRTSRTSGRVFRTQRCYSPSNHHTRSEARMPRAPP